MTAGEPGRGGDAAGAGDPGPGGDAAGTAFAAIERAFAGAPRPPDEALLHPQCFDDNDIVALYAYAHWRDVPDEVVEREYAALSFLSPDGFRHFLPAYMRFTLGHPGSGAAAVDATIWSLAPGMYADEDLRAFARSKYATFDDEQRVAVVGFLDAVKAADARDGVEADRALAYWRP
jgi:hypothetical protein